MTDRYDLLALIKDLAIVHGKVTLSSGREADYYVDLRRVTLSGRAAPLVGRVLLDLTKDLEYDAVGGLTMGADPVATAMLHAGAAQGRTLDAFVVRKEAKAHGLQRRIEGPDIRGRRVLVLEDTSTTGGSLGETAGLLILLCGAYLAIRGYLNWRIPAAVLGTVAAFAAVLHQIDPTRFASAPSFPYDFLRNSLPRETSWPSSISPSRSATTTAIAR